MARDVVFYGTHSRKKFLKTFLNVQIVKQNYIQGETFTLVVNLLCFVLLFCHQYFFITISTSLYVDIRVLCSL